MICTGRMFRSTRDVAARMGVVSGPAICYQGAMIADLGDGEIVLHRPMAPEPAAGVVRHLRTLGRHLNAYIDDQLYVDEVDRWALHYARQTGVRLFEVEDLEAEVLRRPPTKLVAISDAEDVDAILPELQARWRGELFVERSQPEYIEFADGGVSKSRALAWLCEREGLRRERVVACGDGENDVDMLSWAGVGVAVAEAAATVRASADLVVAARRAAAPLRAARGGARLARRGPVKAEGGAWRVGAAFVGPRRPVGWAPFFPPDGTRVHSFRL